MHAHQRGDHPGSAQNHGRHREQIGDEAQKDIDQMRRRPVPEADDLQDGVTISAAFILPC